MRIIGIRVYDGDGKIKSPVELMRGVKKGWFPFGDFPEPNEHNWGDILKIIDEGLDFYNLFTKRPRITVTGIVGKNGSGKSTILEYMMMILNNTACHLLYDQYAKDEQQPSLVWGLFADLYYESNRQLVKISCINTEVTVCIGESVYRTQNLNQSVRYEIASSLFYLILCNYGTYSLNSRDYDNTSKLSKTLSKVNGEWLKRLFNLEENYLFPVTITPQRIDGNIDVNQLKDESVEKLVALMIFAESRGYHFMPGYKLSRFKFKLKSNILQQLTTKAAVIAKNKKVKEADIILSAESIVENWVYYLGYEDLYYKEYLEHDPECEPFEVFKLLFKYIGYTTLHLCVYYEKFRQKFDVIKYIEWHQQNKKLYELGKIHDINAEGLFEAILYDHSNLTFGIRKCIRTIKEVKSVGLIKHDYLCNSWRYVSNMKFEGELSLDEILLRLPPPLFELDAFLVKDDTYSKTDNRFSIQNIDASEIQLSKLSSGEKQFLYSLSSTLFHIKNMDESIALTKGLIFKDVCLVFDEAELYYHPEYQQEFVFNLLNQISWLRLGHIQSIQIVIATHSPFILSDIKKDDILFMKDGQNYRENMTNEERKEFASFGTFGANYYDLLRNGFFLRKHAIGSFAAKKVEELRHRIEIGDISFELKKQIEVIADPLIRGYLLYEMNQKQIEENVPDKL